MKKKSIHVIKRFQYIPYTRNERHAGNESKANTLH